MANQRGRGRNRGWCRQQYGTDSKFEHDLKEGVLSECEFQGDKIDYIIPHSYTPDFISPDGKYLIEVKGRFVDMAEARKYVHIREALPEGVELIFLLYRPTTPLPGARVRKKCGTKRTHADWCEFNSFQWFTRLDIDTIL